MISSAVMERTADVVIVGSGPAGAMAGIALAGQGFRPILLDKKRFPRDKPCGGGIRAGFVARFPEVAAYVRRAIPVHEIRKVVLESPAGHSVRVEREAPLYLTFRRLDFDAALVELARARGARVVEGARVTDVRVGPRGVEVDTIDGRVFGAALVIGADGVNSVVARATGLHAGWPDGALAIDMMEETERRELEAATDDAIYVAYGYRGYPGYGYVFPKAAHVDAGVGFLLSFFKERLDGAPYAHHVGFLEDARRKGIVSGRSRPENFKAYRIPLGGPLPRTYADRVLLCGDAGGFVNGYTGEGIYHALVTGERAGHAAAAALASGDASAPALARYEEGWRREIGEELAEALRIQRRLFARPRLADAIVAAAAADRRVSELFTSVALGEARLRGRRLELLARVLLAAVRGRLTFRSVLGI